MLAQLNHGSEDQVRVRRRVWYWQPRVADALLAAKSSHAKGATNSVYLNTDFKQEVSTKYS